MDRFLLRLLLLLLALVFVSKGKTINSLKQNANEIKKRIDVDELAVKKDIDFKRHEVRPIEAGYNDRRFHNSKRKEESNLTKPPPTHKRLRRCFCGISPGASCPDGFLETQIRWNDPLAGPLVPPHFQSEGPPYDVGDDWSWLQDSYDGDLQQNAYGWNWKERFNDNSQAGPQLGGYPCGQQGWCCKLNWQMALN